MNLTDRRAIISGATAGIGEAAAREFVASGARVVLNARRAEKLKALEDELNSTRPSAVSVAGDAGDSAIVEQMLTTAREKLGGEADLVLVNAGRGLGGSVCTSNPDKWEGIVQLNIIGALRLARAAALRMIAETDKETWPGQPRDIVILGSTVGRHISPFSAVYGATKFAVNSMAEALRREIAHKGIRVSLIEPGVVLSEFQATADYSDDLVNEFKDKWGPLLLPEDVARTISFIASQPAHVHINDVVIRATRQDYP